jgi:Zn ribbon nucleic-acid-binding protein
MSETTEREGDGGIGSSNLLSGVDVPEGYCAKCWSDDYQVALKDGKCPKCQEAAKMVPWCDDIDVDDYVPAVPQVKSKSCPRCWVANAIENKQCPLCGFSWAEAVEVHLEKLKNIEKHGSRKPLE